MAGLLSSVTAILRLATNITEDGVAGGILKSLEDDKLTLINADGSMFKLLGKYVVEPIAVVSEDLKDVEELDHILGLHSDMFTGYYMQVFDILRNQYDLSISTIVDTLATDNGGLKRVLTSGMRAGIELSNESEDISDFLGALADLGDAKVTDIGILTTEGPSDPGDSRRQYETTNEKLKAEAAHLKTKEGREAAILRSRYATQGKNEADIRSKLSEPGATAAYQEAFTRSKAKTDNDKEVYDRDQKRLRGLKNNDRIIAANKDIVRDPTKLSEAHSDLLIPNAIQRTLEIRAEVALPEPGTDGVYHTRTFIIPVTVKLGVIFTSNENILNAIETKSDEYSFSERLDEYRAGAISLTDFVLASDIIKKYKKHKLRDKDELLKIIDFRELSGNSKILTNGFAGFEKYYNMYIISPETKKIIEKEVRSKLTHKGKDSFLERGNGLSVTVMDPDYERIIIMIKDIRGKTDLSFKNAVKKDKNGSDYGEIVKALIANKPPAF